MLVLVVPHHLISGFLDMLSGLTIPLTAAFLNSEFADLFLSVGSEPDSDL